MTTITAKTITSFTLASEITNLEEALEWRRRNQRLFDSLPRSAPRKMRKAYEERMALCDHLVMKYSEV